MNQQRPRHITELWRRFADKEATAADMEQLFAHLQQDENKETLLSLLEEYFRQPATTYEQDREYWMTKLQEIMPGATGEPAMVKPLRSPHSKWWAVAAASIMLVLATGVYFWLRPGGQPSRVVHSHTIEDVQAPQTTKAMITLADGSVIAVDSLTTLSQHTVALTKTTDGKIVYSGNTDEVAYNTLTNPRGSQVIDMTLADGSRVWLNAGSSVTYPVAFAAAERKVSINGEAYLEVAHDKAKPFYVTKGDVQVQVLGTHFNVNAYDDESGIKVTLLEGSVKVSRGHDEELLRPGQQAQIAVAVSSDRQLSPAQSIKIINNADIEKVMAWKNGLFNFDGADLETVMRQLEKWYDITVIYEKGIPTITLGGKMKRNEKLSGVMAILKRIGVNFRMEEGRKLVVMP